VPTYAPVFAALAAKESLVSDSSTVFIYQDARGNITAREITDISETETYLQGYCHLANDLRTFRKERILELLGSGGDVDSKVEHYISTSPLPKEPKKSHHLLDVCFTGLKSEDKKRLKEMAESKGMVVRSSVTRSLNFLCCGYNAGPKKIEKARAQNVIALNEEQFIQLLETGEVPES
jgi:NAD-dependent DNA ligase